MISTLLLIFAKTIKRCGIKASILSLKGMLAFCIIPRGYFQEGPIVFSSIHIYFSQVMKTNQRFLIVAIEVEVIRLVKVRAYKRVRFGKVERVRSHYRSY